MNLYAHVIETPVADLCAMVDEAGALVELDFLPSGGREAAAARAAKRGYRLTWDSSRSGTLAAIATQLAEYFRRERRDFDLPLAPRGTPFQLRVWEELRRIPYGATVSYAELAARVGNPGAFRAVGRANGTNPIPVVIPCHRVINTGGALGGYGGGLPVKQALLELEGVLLPTSSSSRSRAGAPPGTPRR